MDSQAKFNSEYAKSGRGACKGCGSLISKGALRLSYRVRSPFHDGFDDKWHHAHCFWKSPKVPATIKEADFRGLDSLRYEHQEEIRDKIETRETSNEVVPSPGLVFKIELSKSNRGKCKHCSEFIEKNTPKISVRNFWYHVSCFAPQKASLGFSQPVSKVTGFDRLPEGDKTLVQELLDDKVGKERGKRKNSGSEANGTEVSSDQKKSKIDPETDKKLKKQAEEMWKLRDSVKEFVHKKDMMELLEDNGQKLPNTTAEDKILDRLVDCMYFGALEKCSECQEGQLVFSTTHQTYTCLGHTSGWAHCEYQSQQPNRHTFKVDREKYADNEWLANTDKIGYKFGKIKARVYDPRRRVEEKSGAKIGGDRITKLRKAYKSCKSHFSGSQRLTVKGGTAVDPACDVADVTHVYKDKKGISYTQTLAKTDIQKDENSFYKIQLLEHDNMTRYFIYRAWGRVGYSHKDSLNEYNKDLKGAKEFFKFHFEEKSGNPWPIKREDFEKKPHKYFPMDLDYGEDETDLAGESTIAPGSKSLLAVQIQDLINMIFDTIMIEQTLKEFEIDMEKMPLGKISKNQLQSALKVLTDLQTYFENTPKESQKRGKIVENTNKFYTLIPHDFGGELPPEWNMDMIKQKAEMIDSLMEIEVTASILKDEKKQASKHVGEDPLDTHYRQLETDIEVLDRNTDEFKILQQYVKNTHATTHGISLEIVEIFKICRHEEGARFEKFNNMHNRQLLWHGSRLSNWVGILKSGLKIAPPEAPVTGYMFGKGIYFADMVTKSANYCYPSTSSMQGLMVLSEVALGDMWELKDAKMVEKLPKGKHSVKGMGCTYPEGGVDLDGAFVPNGKQTSAKPGGTSRSLLYNEYIVYDVGQVKMKYLFRMKFNTKSFF